MLIFKNPKKILAVCLLSILLLPGYQAKVQADPFIIGASSCWYDPFIALVFADAFTWVSAVDYPEAQVIGQIMTITMPGAPFVQVMPLGIDIVSPILGGFVYQIWERIPVIGFYTVSTLHGYIDEDGTEHESGTSHWGCFV